ncbi:hypothetical protein BD779DRAFT_1500478 [Infundibulicybe gibba]|nr:hypothetical protein BD779DRAFT_1500478 [Infundibulicybe gibba]
MSNTDWTQPLATLLRNSTFEAHEEVAHSPNAMLMLSGKLERDEYVRYLMMLWYVYEAFETALDRHATHPALEPTYNPTLLARTSTLTADISYLLQVPESSWKSHPIHVELMASTPSTLTTYVSRINELADSADPTPLLAHSYVRYLGDLSGGQTIRHTLAKAYDLDEASALGLSFYAFKELRSAKLASQGEMKRIKDWFRAGMNTAGDASVDVKGNIRAPMKTISTIPAEKEKETVLDEPSSPSSILEKTYPISTVAAVIAAVCLGHFILVVGGFTGDRGYQKLLALEQWLRTAWQATSSSD